MVAGNRVAVPLPHSRPRIPTVEEAGLKSAKCRFESDRGYSMTNGYHVIMVRKCSREGCSERSVAEIRSKEPFDGATKVHDVHFSLIYSLDVCEEHFKEM